MSNNAITGYRILKPIGSGGTSQVFLAIQKSVGRTVAVKVLSTQFSDDKSFSERFLKEANCGVLNHPNIITIFDAGKSNGRLYIAMEYLLGGDLKRKMQSRIAENDVIKIITQISQALSHAHNNNFTHRDIKPGNILFDENNNAVLADFGIAKTIHFSETTKAIEGFIGTPNYISPEQIENHKIDHRVDLYCLGIVYYEILTGKKLFTADSPYALLFKHLKEPAPELPVEFKRHQTIIHKLLEKKPDNRYQSADQLLADLHTFQISDTKPVPVKSSFFKTAAVLASLLISLSAILFFQFQEKVKPIESEKTTSITPSINDGIIKQLKEDIKKSTERTAESERKRSELETLSLHLTEASRYLSINLYVSADENNALYEFQRVLEIQPENTQAQYGIKTIINHYKQLARNEKEKANYAKSIGYINAGLIADETDDELLNLLKKVNTLLQQKKNKKIVSSGLKKSHLLIKQGKYTKAKKILLNIQKLDRKNKKTKSRLNKVNKLLRKEKQIKSLINQSINLLNDTPITETGLSQACENIYSLSYIEPKNIAIQTIKASCARQYLLLAKQADSTDDALELVTTGLNYMSNNPDLIEFKNTLD